MAKMLAAVVTDVGKTAIMEFDRPEPGPGEVLVKIRACALCTAEQRVFRGITNPPKPYIGGHEASGTVEGLGERLAGSWKIGDRVALRTYPSCGVCYYCRKGYGNQCENVSKIRSRFAANAGLCEYIVLPEFQLFRISDNVSFEQGALCEPISCVLHSIDKCKIDFGDDVVIIGAGIMGILHTQFAKMRGARVIVAEIDEKRRQIARSMGADVVFSPLDVDQVEYVKSLTEGRGADAVVNTTSVYEVAGQAIGMSGKLGRTIMYASQHPDEPVPVKLGQMHSRETELIGTISPAINDFRRAAKLLCMGAIHTDEIITDVVPMEQVQRAFESAVPGAYRIIVRM